MNSKFYQTFLCLPFVTLRLTLLLPAGEHAALLELKGRYKELSYGGRRIFSNCTL